MSYINDDKGMQPRAVEAFLRQIKDKNMEEKKVEEKKLPEVVEAVEVMMLEKMQLKEENLQLKIMALQNAFKEAQRESLAFKMSLKAKYELGDNDEVDVATCKILRK